jgi:hypothetical protein
LRLTSKDYPSETYKFDTIHVHVIFTICWRRRALGDELFRSMEVTKEEGRNLKRETMSREAFVGAPKISRLRPYFVSEVNREAIHTYRRFLYPLESSLLE